MYKRVRNTSAWVEREGSTVRLMSYKTLICEINTETKTVLLSPASRCSRTTIRHLSNFLNEFGISYYDAKAVLVDQEHKPISTESGFNICVSYDPRFKFHATHPYCLL